MKTFNKKFFLILLGTLGIGLGTAFVLSSCGGKSDPPVATTEEVTITSYLVNVNYNTTNSTKFMGDTFHFLKDDTVSFSVDDFIVYGYKSNGESIVIQNFQVEYDNSRTVSGNVDITHVKVIYNGEIIKNYVVEIENDSDVLPTFTGVSFSVDDGIYVIDHEFTYTGEEINPMPYVTTSEANVTLKTLFDEHKVTIGGDGTYKKTNANNSYYLELIASEGYYFKVDGDKTSNMTIKWSIKKSVLEVPTVSNTSLEFSPQMDSNSKYIIDEYNSLLGNDIGPTIDYHGNEELLNVYNDKGHEVGTYSLSIVIKNENSLQDNYTFIVDGKEKFVLEEVQWEILPKKFGFSEIAINDATHLKTDGKYHYTYTGEEILPETTIPNEQKQLFNFSGEYYVRYEDDSHPYNLFTVGYKCINDIYYDEETSKSYIKSFAFSDGSRIEADYQFEYIIDKKQTTIDGLNSTQVEIKDVNYLDKYSIDISNFTLEEDSLFTQDTITYLKNLNGFNINCLTLAIPQDAGYIYLNDAKEFELTFKYYEEETNWNCYIPYTFNLTINVLPKEVILNPHWNTDNYGVQNASSSIMSLGTNVTEIENLIEEITYSYKFSLEEDGLFYNAPNTTDAGYYKKIAALPETNKFIFFLSDGEDVEEVTSVSLSYYIDRAYYQTNLSLYNVYVVYNNDESTKSNELDSFDIPNTSRTIAIDKEGSTPKNNELFNIEEKIYKYGANDTLIEVEQIEGAGKYCYVLRLTFKDGVNYNNYYVDGGIYGTGRVIEYKKDFEIFNTTIIINTEDLTSDNYVGYDGYPSRYAYSEYWETPKPKNLPGCFYSFEYVGEKNGFSHGNYYSGEEGSWELDSSIFVRKLYGYGDTTIEINSTVMTNYKENSDGYLFALPRYYFDVGPAEEEITSINFNGARVTYVEGYNYFKFTIPDDDTLLASCDNKFIIVVSGDIYSGDVWGNYLYYKKDGEGYYNSRLVTFNSAQYYIITRDLEAGTYYIRIKAYSVGEGTVTVLPYLGQIGVSYEFDGLGTQMNTLVVNGLINVAGNSLYIPQIVDLSSEAVVSTIAPNAFNDEVKGNTYASIVEEIFLPNSIDNIGDGAFVIDNLARIYYDGTLEDWNNITFGTNVFKEGNSIKVYLGNTAYDLNPDYSLTICK